MTNYHLYAPYNTWEGGKADTHCTMPGQDSGAGPGVESVGKPDTRAWELALLLSAGCIGWAGPGSAEELSWVGKMEESWQVD